MSHPATDPATIPETVAALRETFASGRTRPLEWRQRQLDGLLRILDHALAEARRMWWGLSV